MKSRGKLRNFIRDCIFHPAIGIEPGAKLIQALKVGQRFLLFKSSLWRSHGEVEGQRRRSISPSVSALRCHLPMAAPQGGSIVVERQSRHFFEGQRDMMHADLAQHRGVARAVDDVPGAAEADDGHARRKPGLRAGR